jgi:hypothetical protein
VHWGTFAVAGLTSLPSPWREGMRRLLTEPPRRFAADVAALAAAGGATTQVALTTPGTPVVLLAPVPLPSPVDGPAGSEGTG